MQSARQQPLLEEQNYLNTGWDKVWSRLSAHLQLFFQLLARTLTIFDKKRISMCQDKKESPSHYRGL